MLKKGGFYFPSLVVETKINFEKQFLEFKPEAIIYDHSLPQFNFYGGPENF